MSQKLPSEIVSLVHHVKLNETGWWEKAIQNITISTFGINGNAPLTMEEVFSNLQSELDNEFEKSRFIKQFDILRSKKTIVTIPESSFILSDEAFAEFKDSFEKQQTIEQVAEQRFVELTKQFCPDLDAKKLWIDFNEHLLLPLIKEIGAKTYELISGEESISIEQYGHFSSFLNRFGNDERTRVQAILMGFFDFKNESVKGFVIRQLNAYFFIEATNLNQQTVDMVYSLSKSQANLKIYVDTNFLLTLLDLHDNPSNEATFSLLELIEEIKNRVKVKFYVLPVTVEEFQNLISKFKEYIKALRPSMNYAVAAENSNEFSGIIKRYFQKCHERKTMLNVDDYFDPYLDNFTVNIRKKGLEIEQDKMEKYSIDQRVIDDLLGQVEYRFEKNQLAGKYSGLSKEELESIKQRIYDKFNHDCKLWYYVKDRRPAYVDSTKDISNWILTLDFSFLEFDKYKQYIDKTIRISICLHPNEFISMLQFWVPRTQKFENAILGNFRLPFFFREVDSESERVSVEILKALSQYEDSATFTSDLVTEILTNKALRQKIKPSNSVDENAALIKEEIFKKYESAAKQLATEKSTNLNLESELLTIKSSVYVLNQKIDKLHEYNKRKIEKELHSFRKVKIQESEHKKDNLKIKIDLLNERMTDYDSHISNADKEVTTTLNSFKYQMKSVFFSKEKLKEKIAPAIHNKFYDAEKYRSIKDEHGILSRQYDELLIPTAEEKLIVFCENQNSKFLNDIGFEGIHFFPERDSSGVFIKTVSNPTSFGLRDRDYLTDEEIIKIKKQHPNYFILKYYCFENYLYHPENIRDLNLQGLSIDEYINELVKQKKTNFTSIVSVYKPSRNNYQEFKIIENNFRDRHDEAIISYLESDDYEQFLKSYDLKTKFNKTVLQKFKLSPEHLTSTEWFKNQIQTLLSI